MDKEMKMLRLQSQLKAMEVDFRGLKKEKGYSDEAIFYMHWIQSKPLHEQYVIADYYTILKNSTFNGKPIRSLGALGRVELIYKILDLLQKGQNDVP